ncbi:MAG: phage tail protein [Clostridiaceae bacterium]|nr:phage tail protein [Clostridiaceae bacterium]
MAQIGLRYPVYSPLTEDETAGTWTYGTGKVAAKAIRIEMSLNIADSPLYADDDIAERVREFIDGTMTFTADELDNTVKAEWLGSQLEDETVDQTTVKVLKSSTEDLPGYFGFGCIVPKVKNKTRKYRAIIFTKVQFAEPNETAETKGQNISWQTPAIEGKIMRRVDGLWKEETTVDSFELAKAWLTQKLNIGSGE